MKHRLSILSLLFFVMYSLFGVSIGYAQVLQPPDNLALFGQLQTELAGTVQTWASRIPDANNNNTFRSVPITPKQVMDDEEAMRTTNNPNQVQIFNVNPTNPQEIDDLEYFMDLYDADSWNGAAYRSAKAFWSSTDENYFTGNYIVSTNETSELGKIKSIYNQITSTVTRFDVPAQGDSASYCLTEGVGKCRHMAAILQESLEAVGVNSEFVGSVKHVWVRVTLTDPEYAGITFDLDPTWYEQPIPLPPRDRSPMSADWRQKMLAITTGAAGAIDLNGRWTNGENQFAGRHAGNSFTLINLTSKTSRALGKPSLIGTLAESTITGQKYLIAEKCPNLDTYVSANGTVAVDGNSISVTFMNSKYNYTECVDIAGSEFEDPASYTRVQEATPAAGAQ